MGVFPMSNLGGDVLKNAKGGNCYILATLQLRAMDANYPVDLVEHAFSLGPEARINCLCRKSRSLTVLGLDRSKAPEDRIGFVGPRTAFTEEEIRRLANNYNVSLDHEDDWRSCVRLPDGNGDALAIRLLSRGLGMSNIEIVREVGGFPEDVRGKTYVLKGERMVLWQPGHFAAIARNVSSPYRRYVMLFIGHFCLR